MRVAQPGPGITNMITPATMRVTPRAKTMTRHAVSSPRLRLSLSRNRRSRTATLGGVLASILWKAAVEASLI